MISFDLCLEYAEIYEPQIQELKDEILELTYKLADLQRKLDSQAINLKIITTKLDDKLADLEKLKDENFRLSQELHNTQIQEKRLMYTLYLAHEDGYPVEELYEQKVTTISTKRFEQLVFDEQKSEKLSGEDLMTKMQETEIRILDGSIRTSQQFDSIASYEPIAMPNTTVFTRPKIVSKLKLNDLSPYQSTEHRYKNLLEANGPLLSKKFENNEYFLRK